MGESVLYDSLQLLLIFEADEMSMHLAMGCVLIQVFTFQQPPEIQRRNTIIIVLGLTSFIIYHCVTDEFIMHVTLFVTLVLTVIWKTRQIIKERIQNEDHKKKMSALATFGTCQYILHSSV